MGLLEARLNIQDLSDCDLIIEAVFEDMDVKKDIFRSLDKIAHPKAILASNTSYLDLNEIADATSRPEQVVGIHFFSPAYIMRLVEIVRGEKTSNSVIKAVHIIAKKIDKIRVMVGVCYGFVGNRMLAQRQREAEKLILEGAMPWDVDRVLCTFGFPMGPFDMRDLAGLDVSWDREKNTSATIRDVLNQMGRHGLKTNAGFYDYDGNRQSKPSSLVEDVIVEFCQKNTLTRRLISDTEILNRCLYSMINEGANILMEGIAEKSSDIDVIWIAGYGWPSHTVRPIYWAEQQGLAKVLVGIKEMNDKFGDDFKPSPLLEEIVRKDGGFKDAMHEFSVAVL